MNDKITKTDYCYIAGYLDGDGCFYIGKKNSNKRLSQKYIISIAITSVNSKVLYFFKSLFGGGVGLISKEFQNQKPLYQWSIQKKDTINLCEKILPYLVEKKEECITAIDFIRSKNDECLNKMKILKDISNLVSKYHKNEFEKFKNTITPSEEDFAYLAGFIDAECSLNIQKYKPSNKPNYVYKILLQCNNTKAPVFKWLLERFGGHIHFIDRRNNGTGRKNQLTWRLSGRSLFKIIDKIQPFLKHKQPVCDELIKFHNTTIDNGGDRKTESFKSSYSEIIKIRENIVKKVHLLNSKGNKSYSGG